MTVARPQLRSEEVKAAAVEAFLGRDALHGRLGCQEADEDDLRDALEKAARRHLDDPSELARSFAEESGMEIEPEHFEIADELTSVASDIHRRLVTEWVASGSAVCTVPDTARVMVRSAGETLWGCAFCVDRLSKNGQFAFVPDDKFADWRHREGGVTTYRILEWENVMESEPPSEVDLELVAGQRKREETDAICFAEQRRRSEARLAVEKRRKEATVEPTEAETIWNELGLGDDVDRALRIHNAILAKLLNDAVSAG